MNERLDFLRDKASKLSLSPGVYLMKDSHGKIIYVGKAKALKNRVSNYFQRVETHEPKTAKLVENIYDFDFIVTNSELDALVLEASQIKLHNPKYNMKLKDDTGYNYIKISGSAFPKITYALQTSDKTATYIGPYTSDYTIRQTVEEANRIFNLPTCSRNFPRDFGKERPCLNHHIKRCMGVCQGNISEEEYSVHIKAALDYIRGGSKDSVKRLSEEMEKAAEELDFERAAKLRDQVAAIIKAEKSQKIMPEKTGDYDIIAFAQNSMLASVALVKYRGGRLVDKENFYIGDEYAPSEMRYDFLIKYYSSKDDMPKDIEIDHEIEDKELLEQYFKEKFGHRVTFSVPKRGEGLTQIMLAKSNASEYLSLKVGRTAKELNALEDLAGILGLSKIPVYIESYDISNLGEQTKVGGMVVYRNGRPYKPGYRKFTIKDVAGQDDYACMQEVLRRRFTRYFEYNNNENNDNNTGQSTSADGEIDAFGILPDLILLDGGKGHVAAVREVLESFSLNVPLFGLVKDEKHRTRAVAKEGGEIQVNANKQVFSLLTNIQDEVHRFSITFQRARHQKKSYEMLLTKVTGIGDKKAIALIKQFKTKQGLKEASIEELKTAAKISTEKAEELYNFIQENFA